MLSEEDLNKIQNCGKKSVEEMKTCLANNGVDEIPACVFELSQEEIDNVIKVSSKDDDAQAFADALELLKTIMIEDVTLTVRARNCLTKRGIKTLYDFAILSEDEAIAIPNFGKRSVKEMATILKGYGVSYPLDNIDFSDIHPSLKYTGLSDETLTLLFNSGIVLLDDLANLSEEQLFDILAICPEVDSLKIIYSLSTAKDISLKDDYFEPYLKFTIEEIGKGLKNTDLQILSLAYGLFGQKKWPHHVLSSSLALNESELTNLINKIVSIYLTKSNYLRLKPLFEYRENKGDELTVQNGYLELLDYLMTV